MNKKKTLLFALISILCPVWLVLNIVLVSLTENYFLRNHTDDIFMGLFVVWMPVGWIFGLGTGIAAVEKRRRENCGQFVCQHNRDCFEPALALRDNLRAACMDGDLRSCL